MEVSDEYLHIAEYGSPMTCVSFHRPQCRQNTHEPGSVPAPQVSGAGHWVWIEVLVSPRTALLSLCDSFAEGSVHRLTMFQTMLGRLCAGPLEVWGEVKFSFSLRNQESPFVLYILVLP